MSVLKKEQVRIFSEILKDKNNGVPPYQQRYIKSQLSWEALDKLEKQGLVKTFNGRSKYVNPTRFGLIRWKNKGGEVK